MSLGMLGHMNKNALEELKSFEFMFKNPVGGGAIAA